MPLKFPNLMRRYEMQNRHVFAPQKPLQRKKECDIIYKRVVLNAKSMSSTEYRMVPAYVKKKIGLREYR